MDKIKRQFTFQNFIQFIKLQLAGNILFWGTYIGFFVLHELLDMQEVLALALASIVAHILFFIADSEWVFAASDKRKSRSEIARFIAFMGVNYFINLGIITGLLYYFDITPYIGQFISALFFTFWTYIGLKYWVFRRPIIRKRKRKSDVSRKPTK